MSGEGIPILYGLPHSKPDMVQCRFALVTNPSAELTRAQVTFGSRESATSCDRLSSLMLRRIGLSIKPTAKKLGLPRKQPYVRSPECLQVVVMTSSVKARPPPQP